MSEVTGARFDRIRYAHRICVSPVREELRAKYRGCLLGLAVGDALGAPYEGSPRPLPFKPSAMLASRFWLRGEWTDDTAMALCIAESLVENRCFDPDDIAQRFVQWFRESGKGIGTTTLVCLGKIVNGMSWKEASRRTHEALGGLSAGNGAIMRCAPVALFDRRDTDALVRDSFASARITHWDELAGESAVALNYAIVLALRGVGKSDLIRRTLEFATSRSEPVVERLSRVASSPRRALRPSGFVLDTLEVAFWMFEHTESFADCVSEAIQLGGDTDTQSAVAGALAGAFYGIDSIPPEWLTTLRDRERIGELADKILQVSIQ